MAASRTSFSPGRELLAAVTMHADEVFIDTLARSHNEVVAILNTVPGTTLDRDALRHEFGEEYEAFNVDVWSFEEAARAISPTEDEGNPKSYRTCLLQPCNNHGFKWQKDASSFPRSLVAATMR
jgi:hypothetical protein